MFAISILLSAAVLGLAVVNFGLISRWYNAITAMLAITFHGTLLFLLWTLSRTPSTTSTAVPAEPPSPISEKTWKAPESIYADEAVAPPDYHIIHHMATILSLTFLSIAYLLAFGIMMDITIRGGAKSTLPGERAPGMTLPWNINVQIAQTVLIGTEAFVMFAVLAICVIDRAKISAMHDERRHDVEYGLESA